MKAWTGTVLVGALVVVSCGAAAGLDRGAAMIDSIGIKATPFEDHDGVSGFILGESAVRGSGGDWAFLLGGQYGSVTPHAVDGADFWAATAGLKWYALPRTALSSAFTYGEYDVDGSPDVRTVAVEVKQRLLDADAPIAPFLTAGALLVSSDDYLEVAGASRITHAGLSSEGGASLGAGLDISMTEDMVIVIDATYTDVNELDGGWVIGAAMKYYWN